MLDSRRLLDRASRWFLTNRPQPLAVGAETARFADGVARAARPSCPTLLRGRELAVVETDAAELRALGVPAELRAGVGRARCTRFGLLDVVELAELSERDGEPRDPREVAELYYGMSEHLGIDLALTSVSALRPRRPLARAGPAGAARRPLRLAAGDHPGRAAGGRRRAPPVEAAIAQWERANASRLVRARAGAARGRTRPGSSTWPRCRWCRGSCAAWPGELGLPGGPFVARVPLRWTDQDSYRHLNNASVVTLLEEARIGLFFDAAVRRRHRRASRPGCWWPG